jgi:hypothetical protein
MPVGNAYWNVNLKVRQQGGRMQLGWLLQEWPNSHLTAMHHAVWWNGPGLLVDVTAKDPADPITTHSIVVLDDSTAIRLDRLPEIAAKHFVIHRRPELDRYLEAESRHHEARRRLGQSLWEAGYRAENEHRLALGQPALDVVIPPEHRNVVEQAMQAEALARRERDNAIDGLAAVA